MTSKYLPEIPSMIFEEKKFSKDFEGLFELFTEPLHEELYRRQTFDFLDDLSDGQQLFISYDYVKNQVMQGGFIQFIQNGYIGLLPSMPEWLYKTGADDMATVIDDVLKVYVLNRDLMDKKTTLEEFAGLYDELKEFEIIDERFFQLNKPTIELMVQFALQHMGDFAVIKQ
jgi:hypothetical protein